MKFKLIFTITLIFLSCTKNSIEKEIPENIKLIEEIRNYEVSIFSSEGGTISVENVDYNTSNYKSSHQSGTILNLNAEPKEGFKFIGWTGYKCIKCGWQRMEFVSYEKSISITISSHLSLTANFETINQGNSKKKK